MVSLNSELSVISSFIDEFVFIASKTSSLWFVRESAAKVLVLHCVDRNKVNMYYISFLDH